MIGRASDWLVMRDGGIYGPGVDEDELHVKTTAEHKHIGMHFDLGDGT